MHLFPNVNPCSVINRCPHTCGLVRRDGVGDGPGALEGLHEFTHLDVLYGLERVIRHADARPDRDTVGVALVMARVGVALQIPELQPGAVVEDPGSGLDLVAGAQQRKDAVRLLEDFLELVIRFPEQNAAGVSAV